MQQSLLLVFTAVAWLCRTAEAFAAAGAQVRVVYDPRQSEHHAKYDHPESPARTATAAELIGSMAGVSVHKPSCCDSSEELAAAARAKALRCLNRVHADWYLEDTESMSKRGGGKIDHDTYVSAGTYEVCLRATVAWLDCVDSVVKGGRCSFALTRPPGEQNEVC